MKSRIALPGANSSLIVLRRDSNMPTNTAKRFSPRSSIVTLCDHRVEVAGWLEFEDFVKSLNRVNNACGECSVSKQLQETSLQANALAQFHIGLRQAVAVCSNCGHLLWALITQRATCTGGLGGLRRPCSVGANRTTLGHLDVQRCNALIQIWLETVDGQTLLVVVQGLPQIT